ncbi:MAG: hypothetical protein IPN18_18525 [Ignavibacteriales bacterium]|nr:hypothetical protein [Ignavibacteriales bacterium]
MSPMLSNITAGWGPGITGGVLQAENDLSICWNQYTRETEDHAIEHVKEHAVTIVMASGGYPGVNIKKDYKISNLGNITESTIFYAGTKEKDGEMITSGGRIAGQ